MTFTRLAALFSAIAITACGGVAEGKITGAQPGKCVFSTDVMPKDNFSHPSYAKVKTQFAEGEAIAVRCFYENGTQESYAQLGRVANSMRDSGKYYAEYEWTKPDEAPGSLSDFRIVAFNHNYRKDWDQQRYDLTSDHAECDFKLKGDTKRKYGARADGCMNFGRFVALQSKRMNIAKPANPEFCIRVFMKFANAEIYKGSGSNIRKEPDYVEKTMARGCFNVKVGDGGSSSGSGASLQSTHANALASIDQACAKGPFGGNPAFCSCYKEQAIEAGIGDYSPNAANLWAVTMLNPGAFSGAEREAAMSAASKAERTEAASSDIAMLGRTMQMNCMQQMGR